MQNRQINLHIEEAATRALFVTQLFTFPHSFPSSLFAQRHISRVFFSKKKNVFFIRSFNSSLFCTTKNINSTSTTSYISVTNNPTALLSATSTAFCSLNNRKEEKMSCFICSV